MGSAPKKLAAARDIKMVVATPSAIEEITGISRRQNGRSLQKALLCRREVVTSRTRNFAASLQLQAEIRPRSPADIGGALRAPFRNNI